MASHDPESTAAGEACLEAARQLAPLIRDLAPSIERIGRLPADLVEELRSAGLFHMLLPRDLGGLQVDAITAARVVEEVAKADGSTGWCVMLAGQSGSFAGMMAPDQARIVWADRGVVAGTARPVGRAVITNDPEPGYVVSGSWPFASGSSHAAWFAAECTVYEGDAPVLDAQGNAVTRMTFVPRQQVTIHETWDTLGLRGTASHDFSVQQAFVSRGRGFQVLVDEPQHSWSLYRAEPLIFINHGAQALGVARCAIDCVTELAPNKPGWGGKPLSETPRLLSALAEATVIVDAAALYLYDTSQRLWDATEAGDSDPVLRAKVRLANSHAAAASVRAVDLLHGVMGTSAIFRKSPLERCFRDIHTAAAHVMIGPMTYEAGGRVLLGQPPQFPFF